jgi:hypothetical protein
MLILHYLLVIIIVFVATFPEFLCLVLFQAHSSHFVRILNFDATTSSSTSTFIAFIKQNSL